MTTTATLQVFQVTGKYATYCVTPSSPIHATVNVFGTFRVNRSDVTVSGYECEYSPKNENGRGPFLSVKNWGHRSIYHPTTESPQWGEPVTDNTISKIHDDITAAVAPLFEREDFQLAAIAAAYRAAISRATMIAERYRDEAEKALIEAGKAERMAERFAANAIPNHVPADLIAAYRAAYYGHDKRRTHEATLWSYGISPNNEANAEAPRRALVIETILSA